jgi:hypothetical protein
MTPRMLSFLIVLFSAVVTVPLCIGEDKQASLEIDDVPRSFSVYNSEKVPTVSIGANCSQVTDNKVACHFLYIKFGGLDPYESRSEKTFAEEMKKDPKKPRDEMAEAAKELCVPSSKEETEKLLRDPKIGPARKRLNQQMQEACSAKDPTQAVADFLLALPLCTCQLAVVGYAIDFERVQKGLWMSTPGPQGVCHRAIQSTLKQVRGTWNLTETLREGYTSGGGSFCDAGITPEGKEVRTITYSPLGFGMEPPASCDFFEPLILPE